MLFSIKESYFNIIIVFTPIESTSVEKVSIKKLHLIDELKCICQWSLTDF